MKEAQNRLSDWQPWANSCKELAHGLDQELATTFATELHKVGNHAVTEDDREAAWALYVELSTRISVAKLSLRDGDEAAALKSLYRLFVQARDLIKEHGRMAPVFTALTSLIFESRVRPFTGFWHGRREQGGLERQDERRQFRRELRQLRKPLLVFREVLEALVGGSRVVVPEDGAGTRLQTASLWPDSLIGPVVRGDETGKTGWTKLPIDIQDELEWIKKRRNQAYEEDDAKKLGGLGAGDGKDNSLGLVGLALSGGGIRSATFCLGALQCLQRHGVLRDVDYLSTVSGGGYLGSFLSNQIHARSKEQNLPYDELLDRLLLKPEGRTGDSLSVRWLRNNSKYLLDKGWKETVKTLIRMFYGFLPWGPSIQSWYQERLTRAYIDDGSSKGKRVPLLSELVAAPSGAPYHLLNATVNLPGSQEIDLRGRRSDFFLFSPHWIGSVLTGYCRTEDMEQALKRPGELDLAAAMALSGAALSAHRGMKRSGPLFRATTLLSNARMSTWLPNPAVLASKKPWRRLPRLSGRMRELWGKFDETARQVNVTDGGYVENLGLYQLLRRRCKLILVIDAGEDPSRGCGSLIKASRLAKIDLGIELDIHIANLHSDSDALSQTHWALGKINYQGSRGVPGKQRSTAETSTNSQEIGYLLYLKLSLTGNEPDYVKEYHREHPAFPHQTTADQLFDEEQFEAYRALGEHAMGDLFGEDLVTAEEIRAETFRTRRWLEVLVNELL